jgi:isoleucyl-tRNA synthetase
MSKSKNNFPDLMLTVDKFGADALRFYLLSSPLVRAQEFCFSEHGVDEVAKKHIGRLTNVVSFYEMYANAHDTVKNPKEAEVMPHSTHILDQWIVARLCELSALVTKGLEAYELDRAARPFADFIDDLSTWYIRRSRDRFKEGSMSESVKSVDSVRDDKRAALSVTKYILTETAKLLAPFMPFLAEDIYQRVNGTVGNNGMESVHLESWPTLPIVGVNEQVILDYMNETRRIASLALEARMKAKINVRQPLPKLIVASTLFELQNKKLYANFICLIKDEVNIKEIVIRMEGNLELDTALTPALKEEGNFRELVRAIQDLRKKAGLTVTDIVNVHVVTDYAGKHFIENKKIEIMKASGLKGIVFDDGSGVTGGTAGEETIVGDFRFVISFKK